MGEVINPYGTPQFNSSVLNSISPISTLKETDLLTTKGIEGVNAFATAKNSRYPIFDSDDDILYIKCTDANNGNVASEIAASNNAQTSQLNQQSILLSSERNNYETARLVTQQTEALMNQNNTNLINAIQGFNQLSQQVANQTSVLGSKLDQLGFQMENCCCSIKTLIKDNQIADLQNQLNQANNLAVNAQQSQYLLSQLGKFVPTTAAAAG